MKSTRRFIIALVLAAILFALPATALAKRRVYRAEIVGSTPSSWSVINPRPSNDFAFQVFANVATGVSLSVVLLDPAGSVIVQLCGDPAAVVAVCPYANGELILDGLINSDLLSGVGFRGAGFRRALDAGQITISVLSAGAVVGSGVYIRLT